MTNEFIETIPIIVFLVIVVYGIVWWIARD